MTQRVDPRAVTSIRPSPRLHAAAVACVALATVVVRVPALGAGFALDDFAHMAMAQGRFPLPRAPWNLFAFVTSEADVRLGIQTGALPWWTDPDLRLSFFRPISSLLATFDARVLGASSALQHLHSLIWLILLVSASGLLFRRLLPDRPRAALLATLAFAVEEGLTTPVAWVANRSALVSSTFAVLALLAWTTRRRSRRAALLCEVATLLAILSGEYGLGVLFLRAALTLAEQDVPLRRRLATVAALATALATYGVAHRALGYKVADFPLYRDPTTDPFAYLTWATDQTRRLLQDLVIGLPTAVPPSALTTALVFVLFAGLVLAASSSSSRAVIALALGGIAALAPLASSIANTRLLVLPALGMSGLVGAALDASLTTAANAGRSNGVRALAVLFTLVVGWVHLSEAALRSWVEGGRGSGKNHRRVEAMLRVPLEPSDHVVLISAGDPTTILYFREVRAVFGRVVPSDFRVLTASATAERVFRIDDRTIELEMPRSGLLANSMGSLMRQPTKPLPIDRSIPSGPMTVTALDGGPLGPSRMRFRFDRSLDDPTMKFLVSRSTGLEAFALPPIGGQIGVPPAIDPGLGAR